MFISALPPSRCTFRLALSLLQFNLRLRSFDLLCVQVSFFLPLNVFGWTFILCNCWANFSASADDRLFFFFLRFFEDRCGPLTSRILGGITVLLSHAAFVHRIFFFFRFSFAFLMSHVQLNVSFRRLTVSEPTS